MNAEFNEWWNEDLLTEDNPFVDGTAAYWAWEGWCAAVKAEREQGQKWFDAVTAQHKQAILAEREGCANLAQKTVCDVHIPTGVKIYGTAAAKAIRARSKDEK